MTKEQVKLKARLTLIFWINIISLTIIGLFLLYHYGIDGRSKTEEDFVFERFGILAVIIIVPASLKLFHNKHKKIVEENFSVFLKKIEKFYIMRTIAIDLVILFNFVGFCLVGALNFISMAGIAILALCLCYPVESVIDPEIEDKTNNKQNNN